MTVGGAYVHTYHATFRNRLPDRFFVHTRSDKTRSAGSIATPRSLCRARVGDFHFGLDRRRQGATVEFAEWAERAALVRLPVFRRRQLLQSRRTGSGADGDSGHLFLL